MAHLADLRTSTDQCHLNSDAKCNTPTDGIGLMPQFVMLYVVSKKNDERRAEAIAVEAEQ